MAEEGTAVVAGARIGWPGVPDRNRIPSGSAPQLSAGRRPDSLTSGTLYPASIKKITWAITQILERAVRAG